MDQCSVARHPISATGDLTNRPVHDLHLGIDPRPRFSLVLTGWRLGNLASRAVNEIPVRNTLIDSHQVLGATDIPAEDKVVRHRPRARRG
jgi:hypothetical protein